MARHPAGLANEADPYQIEQHPAVLAALALLGGLAGVLTINLWHSKAVKTGAFTATPAYRTWLITVALQTGLWAVFAIPLWRNAVGMWRHWHGQKRTIAGTAAAFFLLSVSLFLPDPYPQSHPNEIPFIHWRVALLAVVGTSVAIACVVGTLLAYQEARSLDAPADPDSLFDRIILLRREIDHFLFAAGAIIGATTLGSGAQQVALSTAQQTKDHAYPIQIVIAVGLYLSALIAAIYIPAAGAVRAAGYRLIDRICPRPSVTSDGFDAWAQRRKSLDDALGLTATPASRFRLGIAILAPLTGSAVTSLLSGGK